MAVAGPTIWGSGASRRRQRPPDDTGSSQSCPGDSEQSPLPRHRCAYSQRLERRGARCPIKLPSIAKIQETLLRVLPFFSDDLYGRPRLGTGSCVSVRQTTSLVVRGLGRAFLCLSVCLSVVGCLFFLQRFKFHLAWRGGALREAN